MRPPYLVCRRHCQHFERCREVLEIFERAEEEGAPHPLSLLLRDGGCPMFRMPAGAPSAPTSRSRPRAAPARRAR